MLDMVQTFSSPATHQGSDAVGRHSSFNMRDMFWATCSMYTGPWLVRNQHTRELITQAQQRSESPALTLTCIMYLVFTRMPGDITVNDSGLCCACVTSFER